MALSPDIKGIPIGTACEIVDVSRQTRGNWLDRELILGAKKGLASREELCDFAALAELVRLLTFDDARVVWFQVRDGCRSSWEADFLDLAIDIQLKEATIARNSDELAQAIRHARPVRIITLAPVVERALAAFDRVGKALRETEASQ